MKKVIKFLALGIISMIAFQCGTPIPKGQKVVNLPCHQDKYTSTKKEYVASGHGVSVDQVTSRKKALIVAKTEISSLINSNVRSLVDDYTISRTVGDQEEFKSRFESITSETVDQILSNIQIDCQELTYDKKNSEYHTYLALKIDKDDLVNNIMGKLSDTERKELDLDYDRFRKMLDKDVPLSND